MKHTLKITLLLVSLFFITQVVGLSITNNYIDHQITTVSGITTFEALPYKLERPQIKESTSYLWLLSAILVGTLLLLVLMKFKKTSLWKLWFFLAVFSTMAIAFSAFIDHTIAAILAFILALIKIYKPITLIQNLTEVFIYGGLAAIFVPIINIFAAFMLLMLISIYDIIAVRYTKHMVKLAKFQTKSKVFAGLLIPYGKGEIVTKEKEISKKRGGRIAVLGGGDIGFPLIFAGVVMKDLMLNNPELIGFLKTLIIPLFVSLALLYLLVRSRKDKFYPAMPYLTVGCVIGYLIVLLFF
ncbi:MAG: presenilin family intramembrane aspartyl protease [Candidatus Woesearchaeota archaeon]|nr:presenilin family intramembrane aspartyl protease [Candidatus Woesearchaeota archaeon]